MEKTFTKLQGQYLAFMATYTKLHRRPPAEADLQRYFGVTPPSPRPVSTNGAATVRWRGDNKELYYLSPDGRMMAAALQTTADGLRVSTPRELFRPATRAGRNQSFDVTADGQRFLIILAPEQERSRLTVVSNWQAILQK